MTFATYAPRVPAHPTRTGARRTLTPRLLVVHTSEGGEGPTSAEGLAGFIASPATSGNVASYHYIADHERIIPIVPDDYVAYANAGANHDSLSICHPGKAGQTTTEWADPASAAQIEQVARWLADKSDEYSIPLDWLDPSAVFAGTRGVCGHNEVSKAFKRSTHTDPGTSYPWALVLGRARQLSTTEGFLMALTDQQQKDIYDRIMGALPGPFSDAQRGLGGSGDGHRRFALDDQDGHHIATALQSIEDRLTRVEKLLN